MLLLMRPHTAPTGHLIAPSLALNRE